LQLSFFHMEKSYKFHISMTKVGIFPHLYK